MNTDPHRQFMAIYEAESNAIFRFCLLRVSEKEQALDLTQETFTRLWQTLQAGQEMTNARAFVFTVARRLIIDWYRKKKPVSLESFTDEESGESYDPPDESGLERMMDASEGRMLIESIGKIGPSYREAVYLRFVEDLSPPEIAEILGISTNAASVRITRGLEELRKVSGFDHTHHET